MCYFKIKNSLYELITTILVLCIVSCAPLNLGTHTSEVGEFEEDYSDYSDFSTMFRKAGCRDFRNYVWNYIYRIVSIENGKPPPYHTVKEKVVQRIETLTQDSSASPKDIRSFAMKFVEIYALVTEFMDQNTEEAANTLVQLEHGIVEPAHTDFTNSLKQIFADLEERAKALNQECQEEAPTQIAEDHSSKQGEESTWGIQWFHTLKQNTHPLIYGARKVMATAYQSCNVLDLALMPTGYTTRGIQATARHSSGNGWRRKVTDLNALNASHYYISNMSIPASNQCLNVYNYPLVYDYGGKPSTARNSINLFRNAGSGSPSLGVDCSGFVTAAMASAGLRLKKNVNIRSIHVKGINSWMFKTANRNNLSCLHKQDISPQNPLRSGDIVASQSHIFIVEYAGADPFQLQSITNSNKCHSQRTTLNRFNFTIIQSSAHNNGVGINRMHAKIAIDGLGSIERGLKKIASRACYKKFDVEAHSNIKEISILRHDSNNPECRDREIYIEKQECLNHCEPQYLL